MPGICCISDPSRAEGVASGVDRMLERMTHQAWYQVDPSRCVADGVGIGRVSLGHINTTPQPIVLDDGSAIVMDGELFGCDHHRARLEASGCRFDTQSQAELLLRGYVAEGREFLVDLNGKFSAVLWDAKNRQLVVTNDRFGMKPIYYAQAEGKLLIASEIKALLTDPAVPRTPSKRGLALFFAYGQYLGEETSLEAVKLVPPAGWLVQDVDTGKITVDRYHRLGEQSINGMTDAQWLDAIDAAFCEAVERQTADTENLGMSLSGGLDARTMLGVVDHERIPVTTVVMGINGCSDHRSASQLAALTNKRHHNYVLRPDFLKNFETHLWNMVHLTDGQYLSQSIVMPTLPYYREQGIHVLLRGHAGELMHMNKAYSFSLDRKSLAMPNGAALEDWAFAHLRAFMLDAVDGPLMASVSQSDFDAFARDGLNASLQKSEQMEPIQRVWHMFVTERSRRETALSLVKFGSQVETRVPYLDNRLVDLLLAAPPHLKLGETIQGHILSKHRPEFLDVVNINTGTRMGAGPVAQKFAGLKQKVFAKLRVPGYQPYERLGLWLRRELQPTVEELLLSDRCLDRGIFHPGTVRSVVGQHSKNERNHTFLLMALMIVELGQRQFVDDEDA